MINNQKINYFDYQIADIKIWHAKIQVAVAQCNLDAPKCDLIF